MDASVSVQDFIALSQGLSVPVLVGAVWIGYKILRVLNLIETRLSVLEIRVQHVETSINGNSQ